MIQGLHSRRERGIARRGRADLPVASAAAILVFSFALSFFCRPVLCFANAWFTYGFGDRAISLGRAFAGISDDFSAPYMNPAGVLEQDRPQVGAGIQYLGLKGLAFNGESAGIGDTGYLYVGATLPLRLTEDIRLGIGFATQIPQLNLLSQRLPYPLTPYYVLLQDSARILAVLPTFAFSFHPSFSIGGGVLLSDSTMGQIDLGLGPKGEPNYQVDQELLTVFAPIFGLMVHPEWFSERLRGWRVGFVFRDYFEIPYRVPANAFLGGLPISLDFEASGLYTPRQYELGVSYRATPRLLLAGGLSYNAWSDFPDPALRVQVDVSIPLLNIRFTDSVTRAPGFHDTVTPRLGAEYTLPMNEDIDAILRGGYYFEPTPVPKQTQDTNFLDANRHAFSVGAGVTLRKALGVSLDYPYTLNVFFSGQLEETRKSAKDEEVAPENPGQLSIETGGFIYYAGFGISTILKMK